MRRLRLKLEILAEHGEEVLFEAHHQRVNPCVEDHIGALEPHLRRVAGGEILHVHRRGDHSAGDAEPLGNVALHLRAQHQFGRSGSDRVFHGEMIVGDQRLDAAASRLGANLTGEFAGVAAEAADLEAEFFACDPGGGDGVGGVTEDEDALGGEVGRIDRP